MNRETNRERLTREAAASGKYAPLHRHLLALGAEREWRTSFGAIETILGFRLPNSARLYRPWWINPNNSVAHSQGIAATMYRGHHVSWVTMLAHGERRLLTVDARDFRRYGDRPEPMAVGAA